MCARTDIANALSVNLIDLSLCLMFKNAFL